MSITRGWATNIDHKLRSVGRAGLDLRCLLGSIAILYVVGYFSISSAPGNSPYAHPLGWWGWFDQGQYLKSAYALLQHELTQDKHFYPPLYPATGALFLTWSSGHPYFLLNLFCLLWFAYVFIRVADRYAPRWAGVLIFVLTTVISQRIFENYLIPWTTTLSTALLASGMLGLVWMQDRFDRKSIKISNSQVFLVALSLGLLVPTRPGDAVVGGLIGLALSGGYFYARHGSSAGLPAPSRFLTASVVGFAVGPGIYFGFNLLVFGTFTGGYLQVASGNGFFLPDLAEKFISLWLDSETLYGEPNAALTDRFPWLYLGLSGMIWILVRGDYLLRTLAVCITLLFFLYMPYGDLLPNGVWRFLNIHYFKWTFPFFALFAFLLCKDLLMGWRNRAWRGPGVVLLGVTIPLLMLHMKVETEVTESSDLALGGVITQMPEGDVDFIDYKGLGGGFTDVYFGEHRVLLDGHELKRTRDFRLLPMGENVRLVFIRPVVGNEIKFTADHRLVRFGPFLDTYVGTYHFSLGLPKPFREKQSVEMISGYRLGDRLEFSRHGAGHFYVGDGWSGAEDWGRWSVGKKARIEMRLSKNLSEPLTLEFTLGALVHPKQPCQRVRVLANGSELGVEEICLNNDGNALKSFIYVLPGNLISSDRRLTIELVTPDAFSQKELGINDDERIIGVGLKSLRIH